MIPKIIHQIWIGEVEPRETYSCYINGEKKTFTNCRDTIKLAHPDYEYILWNNESILELAKEMHPLAKEKFERFYNEKEWAYAADIMRLYILYKYGGIYLDTDMVMRENGSLNMLPLEKDLILANHIRAKLNRCKLRIQNCVICCSKNNSFMKKVYDRIGAQEYSLDHENCEKYGCTYLTTEYNIHTYNKTPKPKPENYSEIYPIRKFSLKYVKIPKTDCILDYEFFFGKNPKIAKHVGMWSYHPKKKHNYIKN